MNVVIILIIITSAISLYCFKHQNIMERLLLYPWIMNKYANQWYRLLTAGFVHADTMHLAFNMITFYFFGNVLYSEEYGIGASSFLLFYLTGIIVSCIPSYIKKKNNPQYRSLGASGGVSAIVFGLIYLYPWQKINIFFSELLSIPCILYAVLYLIYSGYMAKKGGHQINHDAHLWGALYGFLYMIIIVDPSHGKIFLEAILNPPKGVIPFFN